MTNNQIYTLQLTFAIRMTCVWIKILLTNPSIPLYKIPTSLFFLKF